MLMYGLLLGTIRSYPCMYMSRINNKYSTVFDLNLYIELIHVRLLYSAPHPSPALSAFFFESMTPSSRQIIDYTRCRKRMASKSAARNVEGDVMLDVEVSQITSQQQNTDDRDCPGQLSEELRYICPTISWYAMYASIYFGAGTVAIDSQLQ